MLVVIQMKMQLNCILYRDSPPTVHTLRKLYSQVQTMHQTTDSVKGNHSSWGIHLNPNEFLCYNCLFYYWGRGVPCFTKQQTAMISVIGVNRN